MRIEIDCAVCGGNHFALNQERSDESVIRCGDCGHVIGTLADLKERVAEEVLRRSKIDQAD